MIAKFFPGWRSLPTLIRRGSIKFRLLVLTVAIFMLVIWALAAVSAKVLESHLQQVLARQQFAATGQLARELEQKLQANIDGLTRTAAALPEVLSRQVVEPFLAQHSGMHQAFSGRLMVLGLDGKAIADYPLLGRHGVYYGDRDWFRQVIDSGRPYIGRPVIGRVLMQPVVTIAVPVFDRAGRLRAVLSGGMDLASPDFLGFVADPELVGDGELFVFSLRDQLIVAATDSQRVMTPAPKRGSNTLYDRMVDGFEGSGVAVSSLGIPKLYSGKRVPTADWLIMSALPTEIAFQPLRSMQSYLYGSAVMLTLLAVLAIAFVVRRVLKPLDDAASAIGQMTGHQRELAPLSVPPSDQIGGLVRNFNRLVIDRIAYETALRQSEQRFRLLVEGAPDAIFIQTRGCFAYVNGAAVALFGASGAGQLLGLPIIERIHPDYRAMIAERINRVNKARLANPALEQVYLRLDGSAVAVEASAVPFRFADEEGALVFARDITDKKNVVLELNRYREHLEELVAERTAQLAEAKQAAEVANRAKSAFLATMSHEIRNPLSAVVGLTDLLVASPLNRRQRDSAEQIKQSAQSLRQLIDDILDFSKIEAGALQLEQAPFSLNALLRTTAAVLAVGTRGKAIEALFDVAPDVPDALIGDVLRLQQIVLNLTGNAIKFTETGSIVVAVRCLARQAGEVTLHFAVRDTGIGIPPAQQGRIFERFTQADLSTSRKYGGTGLGLTISARLAALMGSQIGVDSVEGFGSEFHFSVTLPLPAAGPAVPRYQELSGLHVLLVDDQPQARDILGRTGAGFGWQVTTVDSAAAGLDELLRSAAEQRDYDVLLVDWHMPGMDGLEMLRQARRTPGIGLPLVVLMAPAYELDQAVAVSDELYLDGIAVKPLTPASLFEAVQRAYAGDQSVMEARPCPPPDGRLAGRRLLVAEDNEINRSLIETILGRAGAEVVLVVNGQAAVDMLKLPGAAFDAVLMDLQMPVMDGYAATQVIRNELGLRDLPIIAVTAHAMPEDREKARQIGMTDLIVKPLDVDALLDIVAGSGRGGAPKLAGSEPGTVGWDEQTYAELLQQLVASHGADVAEARRLFIAGDRQGAARLVHQLGGVSSFMQLKELARLAALAESALRSGEPAGLPGLFDELELAMHSLAASIR